MLADIFGLFCLGIAAFWVRSVYKHCVHDDNEQVNLAHYGIMAVISLVGFYLIEPSLSRILEERFNLVAEVLKTVASS